jgi:uridine kinase
MQAIDFSEQCKQFIDSGRRLIIGVAGGSGSGKSTLSKRISQIFGKEVCALISQDSYYVDQSSRFDGDGRSVNFDHPSSLEFSLLAEHLTFLKSGNSASIPIYDFATHTRKSHSMNCEPKPIVIVDGTLILSSTEVRSLLDIGLFVHTSEQFRFQRRLARDVRERGRKPEGVEKQFVSQVKPMHDEFVERSKAHATLLISGETSLDESLSRALCAILQVGNNRSLDSQVAQP